MEKDQHVWTGGIYVYNTCVYVYIYHQGRCRQMSANMVMRSSWHAFTGQRTAKVE